MVALSLFALVFTAGCGSKKDDPSPTPKPSSATVEILDGAMTYDDDPTNDFSPNTLNVKVGTTVTWVNNDNAPHTVTADNGSFDSGMIQPGAKWSHTFNKSGKFSYFCTPHPWMKAKVVVS